MIIIIQKTSGSLWQSHKDEVVLDNNGNAFDFTVMSIIQLIYLNIKQKQQVRQEVKVQKLSKENLSNFRELLKCF